MVGGGTAGNAAPAGGTNETVGTHASAPPLAASEGARTGGRWATPRTQGDIRERDGWERALGAALRTGCHDHILLDEDA